MAEALLLALALLGCFLGMGWLALAMQTHWQQVRGPRPLSARTVTGLRLAGALALLVSLWLCLLADHPSMAVLVWVMALAGAALMVAFTLAWRPRLLWPLLVWVRN